MIRSLGEERFFPHLFVTLPGDHTYIVRWFGWMEVEELPGTDLGAMTTVTVFLWHFCQSPGFGFWFWRLATPLEPVPPLGTEPRYFGSESAKA